PVRRRSIALLAALVVLGACDSGDGRQLRPPTASERAGVPTTTTTTPVLPSLPLDAAGQASVSTVPTSAGATSTTLPGTFGLQAPDLADGAIDARFTCDGAGASPVLTWTAPPTGTIELALLVTDDDAGGFVHWAVAGIPPAAGEVGEGATVTGAFEGVNDFGAVGWDGPCPPAPGETHTYRFALYALGQQSELPEAFTGDDLATFATSTALGYAELSATYTRIDP
ncbi:MAG: YbhB/YbcL family Raf kinase inhibitor-like protein, partial [Ilumatobacteraceae bacterium]